MKSDQFIIVFCYSLLAFTYLGPWLASLDLGILSSIVGFVGGFLLSVDIIGEHR
jgi:hypothetical protein